MAKPLSMHFNVAVLHIASQLFPCGFDVADKAPATYADLCEHVAKTGRIAVWSGASDQTMFGDPEVNYAFRAWHDWCHYRGAHTFTREGEAAVAEMQKQHVRTLYGRDAELFCALIDCEVMGQREYADAHDGQFPDDQMAFARAYLAARNVA